MSPEEAIRRGLEIIFPNLARCGYRITSPRDKDYNCIAWSLGFTNCWFWPIGGAQQNFVWPPNVVREETIAAFTEAFRSFGFTLAVDDLPASSHDKIVLYALGDLPTHAAKQLPSGLWSSKLGQSVDIEHTLEGLTGANYGAVIQIFQRPSITAPE